MRFPALQSQQLLILAADHPKSNLFRLVPGIVLVLGAFAALALATLFHSKSHTPSRQKLGLVAIGSSSLSAVCFLLVLGWNRRNLESHSFLLGLCGISGVLGLFAFLRKGPMPIDDRRD